MGDMQRARAQGDERQTAEQVLNAKLDFKTRKLHQFNIERFYVASYRKQERPIQTVHGLQNYSNMKLGDDRVLIDTSVAHSCYNPKITSWSHDRHGLTGDRVLDKRRKDYEYALKMTAQEDLDMIAKTVKDKLGQRANAGPLQLRSIFKFFDKNGNGGISLSEIHWAFAHMGFHFTDSQITALYAQLDPELTGDIRYEAFTELLSEKDFTEIKASWLVPKKDGKERSLPAPKKKDWRQLEYEQDLEKSLELEKEHTHSLFQFVNRDETGYLDNQELQALLLILGAKIDHKPSPNSLTTYIRALDPKGEGHMDWTTFWSRWTSIKQNHGY